MAHLPQHEDEPKKDEKSLDWTVKALVLVVLLVWAANFVLGVVIHSYEGSEAINAIFIALIGGFFTLLGRKSD